MKRLVGLVCTVSMLTAGAARAQPLPLPPQAPDRAGFCAAAVIVAEAQTSRQASPPFQVAMHAARFVLAALRDPVPGEEMLAGGNKAVAAMRDATTTLAATPERVPATVAACDRALPWTTAVSLPADSRDKALSCALISAFVAPFLKSIRPDDPFPQTAPYAALLDRLGPRMDALLKEGGLTPEAQKAKVVAAASHLADLGPTDKVMDACVQAFPT